LAEIFSGSLWVAGYPGVTYWHGLTTFWIFVNSTGNTGKGRSPSKYV